VAAKPFIEVNVLNVLERLREDAFYELVKSPDDVVPVGQDPWPGPEVLCLRCIDRLAYAERGHAPQGRVFQYEPAERDASHYVWNGLEDR
jgi:hypothetical protein